MELTKTIRRSAVDLYRGGYSFPEMVRFFRREAIAALLEEFGSINEVARRTGVHRNTVARAKASEEKRLEEKVRRELA